MEPTEHRPTKKRNREPPGLPCRLGALGFGSGFSTFASTSWPHFAFVVSIVVSFINRRVSDWIDEYGFAEFEDFDSPGFLLRAILVQLSAASVGITLGVLCPPGYAVLWVCTLVAFCVSLSRR